MRYAAGFICLMLVAMLAVGCTHTAINSRAERVSIVFGEGISPEAQNQIKEDKEGICVITTMETGDNTEATFDFCKDDGKQRIENGVPVRVVMKGKTRQANMRNTISGVGSKGADIFGQSVQGYYRGKTQDFDVDTTGASATASANPVQNN